MTAFIILGPKQSKFWSVIFLLGGILMKKLLKMICLAPLLSMFFLSGCRDDGKTRIGIIQIVEHESLDNLREEFISELKKNGL